MARPGGNPDIAKYGFKTDRPEPLQYRVQVRVPRSLGERLERLESEMYPNKQEWLRQAIAEKLDQLEAEREQSQQEATAG